MHKNKPAQVFHFDLYGRREEKYDFLLQHSINDIQWSELEVKEPNFFLVKKDFASIKDYNVGFDLYVLFPTSTSGIKTHRDDTLVSFTRFNSSNHDYYYRPFDIRNIEYDLKKVQRHRYSVMKHMLKENFSLLTCRQQSTFDFQHIMVSKTLVDMCAVSLQTKETTYAFPLYLYPDPNAQQTIDQPAGRVPNLNMEIVNKIADHLGLSFVPEKTSPPPGDARTWGCLINL